MLEEMGYANSADRDGKKVYTITENGSSFLKHVVKAGDEGFPSVIFNTIVTYLSILAVFTAATYYSDRYLIKWIKKVKIE